MRNIENKKFRVPCNSSHLIIHKRKQAHIMFEKDQPVERTKKQAYLRIRLAMDCREDVILKVTVNNSTHKHVGDYDIRYASVHHIYQIPVDSSLIESLYDHGCILTMTKGESSISIFNEDDYYFKPHIYFEQDKSKRKMFHKLLASKVSVQPFGWMEGCVLDGLYDLYSATDLDMYKHAIFEHLEYFGINNGELIYENPRSIPFDNVIYGIECTLPFSVIAKIEKTNKVLIIAKAFFKDKHKSSGKIIDGTVYSAEGYYTIAYPIAVMGDVYGDEDLLNMAYEDLTQRTNLLFNNCNVFLRHNEEDGNKSLVGHHNLWVSSGTGSFPSA